MTRTQFKALKWIADCNGGVVDRYGRVVCRGEHKFGPATFLRLCARGYLVGKNGRLVPTDAGRQAAEVGI